MHSETTGLAPSPMAKQRGPWLRLLNAILRLAGPQAEFLSHSERPWSSATFNGTRHTVTLAFGSGAIEQGEIFCAALPDHEFAIPGHLVADAAITAMAHENTPCPHLTIEAELLLLEDI